MIRRVLFAASLLASPLAAQEPRIASDFEIATAQRQLARERVPLLKMAAHLNLGDLYLSRRETSIAQTHYRSARELAETEKLNARRHSDLTSYATAAAYLGLAEAKLGRAVAAFDAFEEAMRYAGDSAKLWNLYASGMNLVGQTPKAVAAARRAVEIASGNSGEDPSASVLLDIGIYQYALASALMSLNDAAATNEAEQLLRAIISSLQSSKFAPLREDIEREEKFEVFSTTRGEAESYLALKNRAHLRLARIYEAAGAVTQAMEQLQEILRLRSDDPTALTAMARLASATEDRDRYFAEAFDANPFSLELIREYERYVTANQPVRVEGDATARRLQRAVHAYVSGRYRDAAEELEVLAKRFPENDVIRFLVARNDLRLSGPTAATAAVAQLRRSPELQRELRQLIAETEAASSVPSYLLAETNTTIDLDASRLQQLVNVIQSNQLPPEARARLDAVTFSAEARFDGPLASTDSTTTFQTGSIGSIEFRFQQPTEFRGTFAPESPLRLEFRVLGVAEREGRSTLIIEPLRISSS